jgi:membrane fusion protein (multidrug efflux system)
MSDLQLETAPGEGPAALSIGRSIEGERDSTDASAKARRKRFGLRRFIVLVVVGLVTGAAALTGASWLLYRVGHTVISNATVKGRLHRIGARIDGQVKAIDVLPSQRVSKGDVLIRLQDEHFQAALREAQSELNSALKRYDAEKLAVEHERHLRPLEVERCESVRNAATGELEAASSNFGKLEREFVRIGNLIKAGITSTSEVDRAQADRDNARALVKAAEGNLAAAESNCRVAMVQVEGLRVREAGLDVLAAEVERARQHLSAAEADLSATVIHAPEDGWVAERIVEPGGSAKVGEPILTLWLGKPWIEAWVDEKRLSRIGIGKPVDVTLAAFVGRKLSGRVDAIGVLSDRELQATGSVPSTLHSLFPADAMVPIRITVDSGELRLQPGLSAIVGIHSPESSEWLSRFGLVLNFTNAMERISKGN